MNIPKLAGITLLPCALAFLTGCANSGSNKQALNRIGPAITFHASYDRGLDADFSAGDSKLYTAPSGGKWKEAKPGLPDGNLVSIAKGEGRFGDALRFTQKMAPVTFYQGEKNIDYQPTNWNGSMSLWMKLDPDKDLMAGFYCDVVQLIAQSWNDGVMFLEFSKDHTPRKFRYAILSNPKLWNPQGLQWEQVPVRPMVEVDKPPFASDKWTHVLFTFSNVNTGRKDGVGKLYLDGELAGTVTGFEHALKWDPKQSVLALGLHYVGLVDDVAMFNRALTDEEVRMVYGLKNGLGEISGRR